MARAEESLRAAEQIAVIVNPSASGGRAMRAMPHVTESLQALGIAPTIFVTSRRLDAWQQAERYASDGFSRIIAVGGDGTFNEVANGILASGREVSLGLVPAGTGCDLPRTLGIHGYPLADAVRLAILGHARPIDVGRARCASGAERYYLNVAGLGFDARIAEKAASSKLRGGLLSYLVALGLSLADYSKIDVHIDGGSVHLDTRAVFVTVANARYFGGGFLITPMAELEDGLLDLAVIGDISMPELIRNLPKVLRGTHVTHPAFTHARVASVGIESEQPARIQVDGELLDLAPVTFSVVPRALSIVMP